MGKRKTDHDPEDLPDASDSKDKQKDDDSDSEPDVDMVNVEFEWFDPQPAVDFHGLKTLLRQLLADDAHLFDLSALADLILSQPLLGSTVKVDGNETDPYAFLTVINLETHKDKPVIQSLTSYFQKIASTTPSLSPLSTLLTTPPPSTQIGLLLTERLSNMPHATVPPMYTMLLEEITWALEESEPYAFTHYLLLSKTYTLIESTLPTADQPPSKKKKAASADKAEEVEYFHPEDQALHKHAVCWDHFKYQTPPDAGKSDSRRVFQEMGINPIGHLILIEADKFKAAVQALETYLNG
ncbi:p21-C-terminal region-binding protein-domain-containing protein [Dendryphion nanum]|uniref:Protein BCP1 n=1 Tax=Dendryphion nanum TaxID=256645 RepID=A0A9P9DC24_9PLEO|nr:p21-C-terminal region-binding protein-domain-containing protein [Dendryphion nanum]